jgi:hypothetical protein
VRVSNRALERFRLAQVARTPTELVPAIETALTQAPEPDGSFAKRASTASLILHSARRTQPLPKWRVRTVRAATRAAASATLVLGAFLSSVAYGLVADLGGPAPITAVATSKPRVVVMVDASATEAPVLARQARRYGIHVSFAVHGNPVRSDTRLVAFGDDAIPQLNDSGLFGWIGTKGKLRKLERELGWHGRHLLYTTSGPSLAQVLLGDSVGKQVAGKVRVSRPGQIPPLHKGEILEIRINSPAAIRRELNVLARELHRHHLDAVPVTKLVPASTKTEV